MPIAVLVLIRLGVGSDGRRENYGRWRNLPADGSSSIASPPPPLGQDAPRGRTGRPLAATQDGSIREAAMTTEAVPLMRSSSIEEVSPAAVPIFFLLLLLFSPG